MSLSYSDAWYQKLVWLQKSIQVGEGAPHSHFSLCSASQDHYQALEVVHFGLLAIATHILPQIYREKLGS